MTSSVNITYDSFTLLGSEGCYKIQPMGGDIYVCVTDDVPSEDKSFYIQDRVIFVIRNDTSANVYVKPAYSLGKKQVHLVYSDSCEQEITSGNNNNQGDNAMGCEVSDKNVLISNNDCFSEDNLKDALSNMCNKFAPKSLEGQVANIETNLDNLSQTVDDVNSLANQNKNDIVQINISITSLDNRVTALENRVDNMTTNMLFTQNAHVHLQNDTVVPQGECRIVCGIEIDDGVVLDVQGKIIDLEAL